MKSKGKKRFIVLIFLFGSIICFGQKKEIKPKNYGSEIDGVQSYNINYLDSEIDMNAFDGFHFRQAVEYPYSYIEYYHNEALNTAKLTKTISTIYYSDGSVDEPDTKSQRISTVKMMDSLQLDIEHPYYINISNHKLSSKDNRLSYGGGSIRIEKILHNYVKFRIKGDFEFWDKIVDIRAIGANDNYLVKDEEQNEFIDDTTEELERSYKGNIKEFEILMADSIANQRLSIIIPGSREVKFKYEITTINGKDAIINPYTGEVVYKDSPYSLSRIGNYFYSFDEGGVTYLAVLDATEKKLFKLPSYLASDVEVLKEKYLLTRDRDTKQWGVINIKGEVVVSFIYRNTDMNKLMEQINLLK